MRVLLDECIPRPLRRDLPDHEVRTVQEQGWAGLENGELLRLAAAAGFEVFLTVDRGIEFQQQVPALGLAVVAIERAWLWTRAMSPRVASATTIR